MSGDHSGEKYLHSLGLGVLLNAGLSRGTDGSNPSPSSRESANFRFLALRLRLAFRKRIRFRIGINLGRCRVILIYRLKNLVAE